MCCRGRAVSLRRSRNRRHCIFLSFSLFLHCDFTHEPLQCTEVSRPALHLDAFFFFNLCLIHSALSVSFSSLLLPRAYRSNSLKHQSLYEAFLPFLSPALLFVLSTIWTELSPSNIIELQPRIFYLMVGTAFANVTVSPEPQPFPVLPPTRGGPTCGACMFSFVRACPHLSRSVS